ncbi:hypothetical protein BGZ95_003904, partial [Linnemannia exigua]
MRPAITILAAIVLTMASAVAADYASFQKCLTTLHEVGKETSDDVYTVDNFIQDLIEYSMICSILETYRRAPLFLPPTHNITAPQINDLTFSTKHQRKRQHRLAATKPEATAARDALATLSNMSINNASTLTDIDNAQYARRSSRQPCRLFENSSWRIKDQATQEIQTKRVYATLASSQRDKVKEIVLQESRATALDIQVQGSDKSEVDNTSSSASTQPSDIKTAAVKSGQSLHTECKEVETSQTQHSINRDEGTASVKGKGIVTEKPKDTESQDR